MYTTPLSTLSIGTNLSAVDFVDGKSASRGELVTMTAQDDGRLTPTWRQRLELLVSDETETEWRFLIGPRSPSEESIGVVLTQTSVYLSVDDGPE